MLLEDFSYDLPNELIAQRPLPRGSERLMVVDRKTGGIEHSSFDMLDDYLRSGDSLVMNDSRVIPARLLGRKKTGGKVEVFLLKKLDGERWKCLAKSSKPPVPETVVYFDSGLKGFFEGRENETFTIRFDRPELVFPTGRMPLPPYILRHDEDSDKISYQTVYAENDGSVAAPTAGLHFTAEHLARLSDKGVNEIFITLHVGLGTFQPVKVRNIDEHKMHEEEYYIGKEMADSINTAIEDGRRIVSVGTTTARVLEHMMKMHGKAVHGGGMTGIFIRPGFRFQCTGALLTNFHLPCSTLIMLVCAFGGYELMMDAYREAVKEKYRFFSYGDAMLII